MIKRLLQFEPVHQRVSLKDRIYIQLKAAIDAVDLYDPTLDLRLDERDLALSLNCSRTPLREALTRLENDGILKIIPRRGVFILRKSKDEIVDMIHAWAGLESMAARLAAERASDEDLKILAEKASIEGPSPSASEVDAFDDVDVDFHFSIIRLSGCQPLLSMAEDLYAHIRGARRRIEHTERQVQASVNDHLDIVEALVSRDADRSETLVREHVMGLARYVNDRVVMPT